MITGKNSYIGNAVEHSLKEYNRGYGAKAYEVDKISLREPGWEKLDFSGYDTVVHVAGRAHADVSKVSEETRDLYYQVNGVLTGQAARKAKEEGVKQFIYLSSVIIYGESGGIGKCRKIVSDTKPAPANFYGDSKLQGERELQSLACDGFHVAVLRLPFIYGKGSKGNYPLLAKIAGMTPIFPNIKNERSMLYIENLTELIRQLIDSGQGGLFFPQNQEYVTTAQMVRQIGRMKGRRIYLWRALNPLVWFASIVPGKIGRLTKKAFGSLAVDRRLSQPQGYDYQKYSFEESIRRIHENQHHNRSI